MAESKRERLARMKREADENEKLYSQIHNTVAIDMFLDETDKAKKSAGTEMTETIEIRENNSDTAEEETELTQTTETPTEPLSAPIVSEDDQITFLSADLLDPYPDDTVRLHTYEGEKADDLLESIRENGILNPVIVSERSDGRYVILAGHNRVNAAKKLGILVKCIIKRGLTPEQEKLIVIDTNLFIRSISEMRHSELAYVLKTRNDIMKSRGRRTDRFSTYYQVDNKLKTTAAQIGEPHGLSQASVFRHMRLTALNKELMKKVDSNELALNTGVELSYLRPEEQDELAKVIKDEDLKVTMSLASKLKKVSYNANDPVDIGLLVMQFTSLQTIDGAIRLKLTPKELQEISSKIQEEDLIDAKNIIIQALEHYYGNESITA